MNKLKGIIFDIDGTLTSTNELIFESFRHIINKYLSRTLTNDEIIKLFGPTEDVILKEWCGKEYHQARKDYYNFYSQNHYMADLYPGIQELLSFLKSKKILLSVYTGKGREAATITLRTLNIYHYFDMIVTGDDVKEHKPSAEGIQVFLDKFSLSKDEVLMVGDSVADIKASHSAGIKIASVLWDSYAKDKVLAMESDYVFQTVAELSRFLHQMIDEE